MYMTNDDRDLLDLYIEELRGEPVLTALQQKELARKMRAAKTDDVREDARSELIRANLRLGCDVLENLEPARIGQRFRDPLKLINIHSSNSPRQYDR